MPLGLGMSVVLTPLFAANNNGQVPHGSSSALGKSTYGLSSMTAASATVSSKVPAIPSHLAPASTTSPSSTYSPLKIEPSIMISADLGVTSAAQLVESEVTKPAVLKVPTKNVTVVVQPPVQANTVTGSETGVVSWYGSPPGTCASPFLPFGTIVTINDGWAQTTCRVDDRGPYLDNRILDLSPATFSQIASLGTGIVWAHISW